MNTHSSDTVGLKLRKIAGQVGGIQVMYDEGRECMEIVQQLVAVRSAVSGVARDLLAGEATRCASTQDTEELRKTLKTLLDLT